MNGNDIASLSNDDTVFPSPSSLQSAGTPLSACGAGTMKPKETKKKHRNYWGAPVENLHLQRKVSTHRHEKADAPKSECSASSLDPSEKRHYDSGRFDQPGSSAGSTTSSVGEGSIEDAPSNFSRALLRVGVPTPVGSKPGLYSVRIRRASLGQPFGVTFAAAAQAGGVITVAEDLPHLGMRSGDQLIQVNGEQPGSVENCRNMLAKAANVLLMLQHQEGLSPMPMITEDIESSRPIVAAVLEGTPFFPTIDCRPACTGCVDEAGGTDILDVIMPLGKGHVAQKALPSEIYAPMRVLLSASPPVLTDASRGEFMVEMRRSSLKQAFGVIFVATPTDEAGLCIAEDMPHVGLRMGDRVVSINDLPIASVTKCRQELATSMVLRLVLRRVLIPVSIPTSLEPIDERGHPACAAEFVDVPCPPASGLRPVAVPEIRVQRTLTDSMTCRPSAPSSLWSWLFHSPTWCAPIADSPSVQVLAEERPFVETYNGSVSVYPC